MVGKDSVRTMRCLLVRETRAPLVCTPFLSHVFLVHLSAFLDLGTHASLVSASEWTGSPCLSQVYHVLDVYT